MTGRTWQCACGDFKVKLIGEPPVNLCCHCHSCVAPCRFIDEKRSEEGISASKDAGVAVSLYGSSKIQFPAELDGKVSFVKVGNSGRAYRCYTNCCKSQVTNVVTSRFVGFTTNFITNDDGSPYVPQGTVLNVNAKFAFDPSLVKDPKHSYAPLGMLLTFFKAMINPFEPSLVAKTPALFPAVSDVETVPITW